MKFNIFFKHNFLAKYLSSPHSSLNHTQCELHGMHGPHYP